MSTARPQAVATTLIENERVKVTRWRFAPSAETGWHVHGYDYAVVPQTDGTLLLETKQGDNQAKLQVGEPYFRRAGVEHNVVNANAYDFTFIEVEIK
jgi:quercetin dioxygenase-like cupin family protein